MQQSHLAFTPVFPEELWKLVLDKLTNNDDIQRLINSIPNLSHGLNKAKIRIYFANVIPILFKNSFFHGKDILKCRQVCKFWCNKIDHFLETCAHVPQTYLFSSQTQNVTKIDLETGVANRPAICLETATEIRVLRKAICKHPGNPFVGRSVNFVMNTGEVLDENAEDIELQHHLAAFDFIRATHSFIQKFGHHIRFATLDFAFIDELDDSVEAVRTYARSIQCMGHLSNAHSIKFSLPVAETNPILAWFDKFVEQELQPGKLPNLKSFEFLSNSAMPRSSFKTLLKRIMQQGSVTSIGLPMRMWRSEYKIVLENVENLNIDAEWSPDYQKLANMFTNANFQSLTKLRIIPCRAKSQFLNISNLLKQLQTLNLKSLDISNNYPQTKITVPRIIGSSCATVSSIEFISISDSLGVSYEFLYFLPGIKHLTIRANGWLEISYSESCTTTVTLTEVIRKYAYTSVVNESVSIWKMLPSLQIFSILCNKVQLKKFSKEYKNKCFLIKL